VSVENLLSPIILFFFLGILAGALKSCLSIPEALSKSISLYLMMAIGFRGGAELSHSGLYGVIGWACLGGVVLSAALPVIGYALLRFTTRLDSTNAAAVAAHYGSVSVVTFAAAIAALHDSGQAFEPFVLVLLPVMEGPAILTGLVLARRAKRGGSSSAAVGGLSRSVVREALLHGSVLLLLGSFAIGWTTGPKGYEELSPVFVAPFKGILCVFLLDMGLVVARRLSDLRALSLTVAAFGLYMPLIGAAAGIGLAFLLGLSAGGASLLAVLGASASYIVVPAVMRVALPAASPAVSLTLALAITFPFNLVVGIPLYGGVARALLPASTHAASVATQPTPHAEVDH